MESVGLPKGLIRYASEDEIEKKEPFKLTARMKGCCPTDFSRYPNRIIVYPFRGWSSDIRLPGQLFQHKGENISNVFTYKVINKTNNDFKDVHFKLVGIKEHSI
jgi:hypothetical protein